MSNAGHLDFVLNWAAHLLALNVTSFVVGALDGDMLWEMVDRGIPTFSLEAGLDKGDWGWGGQAFIAAVSPHIPIHSCRTSRSSLQLGGSRDAQPH